MDQLHHSLLTDSIRPIQVLNLFLHAVAYGINAEINSDQMQSFQEKANFELSRLTNEDKLDAHVDEQKSQVHNGASGLTPTPEGADLKREVLGLCDCSDIPW